MSGAPHLSAANPNADCGCPEEIWIYRNIEVTIHFEPDGAIDAFFDAGDWQNDMTFPPAPDHEAARAAAFAWIDALPTEEEYAATLAKSA
ncbi:hypothetical protein [Sphingomonas sp. YR710]|uniref:hypothetical protein n=1 Tax=Sphingomonas sp. YR710 TaxID=1882773 RepID=UPI000B85F37A|nr:hypothetical protein [Sphingomonas sp. YR710]